MWEVCLGTNPEGLVMVPILTRLFYRISLEAKHIKYDLEAILKTLWRILKMVTMQSPLAMSGAFGRMEFVEVSTHIAVLESCFNFKP